MIYRLLIGYLVIINIIAFVTYGVDKSKAERGAWRIPEKTLILLAVIGGSIGAYLGMWFFHHKTMKPKFAVGIPIIISVQIAAVILLYQNL